MSEWEQVYIGLGGNCSNSYHLLQEAIRSIKNLSGVRKMENSPFYHTSPVSTIPQNFYTNGVCRFLTSYSPSDLLTLIKDIETKLGKIPKPRDCPRPIDIDILFFGKQSINEPDLQIPHPRWKERLFVLIPLADLTSHIELPLEKSFDLIKYLKIFKNTHHESISLISKEIAVPI